MARPTDAKRHKRSSGLAPLLGKSQFLLITPYRSLRAKIHRCEPREFLLWQYMDTGTSTPYCSLKPGRCERSRVRFVRYKTVTSQKPCPWGLSLQGIANPAARQRAARSRSASMFKRLRYVRSSKYLTVRYPYVTLARSAPRGADGARTARDGIGIESPVLANPRGRRDPRRTAAHGSYLLSARSLARCSPWHTPGKLSHNLI